MTLIYTINDQNGIHEKPIAVINSSLPDLKACSKDGMATIENLAHYSVPRESWLLKENLQPLNY